MSFSPLREAIPTPDANQNQNRDIGFVSEEKTRITYSKFRPNAPWMGSKNGGTIQNPYVKIWMEHVQKAILVLNAVWRFRYAADLVKKEKFAEMDVIKNGKLVRRLRTVTHALIFMRRMKALVFMRRMKPAPTASKQRKYTSDLTKDVIKNGKLVRRLRTVTHALVFMGRMKPTPTASKQRKYTSDLTKEGVAENDESKNVEQLSRFRTVTQAVQRFKQAGSRFSEAAGHKHMECHTVRITLDNRQEVPIPEGFEIGPSQLVELMQDQQIDALQQRGVIQGIAELLKINLEHGIEDDEDGIEKRKEGFGSNEIPKRPGKSFWVFVWEAFWHDVPLIVLMACAVLLFGAKMWSRGPSEGWYDGVSIGAAVLIVIAVRAISDFTQYRRLREWSDVKRNQGIQVIRGGRTCKISVFDVVVGDIVNINSGDQIPADGLLVFGVALTIDESSMTGESLPVYKDAKQPFLLSGCKVAEGYGKMLVTAVGLQTEWGKVMATLTEDYEEMTALQVRLYGASTKFVGRIAVLVAVSVFLTLVIRFVAVDFKRNRKASNAIQEVVLIFTVAMTVVVVCVPERLLAALTLTLAYSMRKIMNDEALVRNLSACETMGSATTICINKTGILTGNEMTVAKAWVADQLLEPEKVKTIPDGVYQTLLVGICQNSSGSVFTPEDGEVEISGSPTESAALAWGVKIGMNFDEIKRNTTVIHVEPFNSRNRRAGVVVKHGGEIVAHWKGDAEMILELSDRWVDTNGEVHAMTQDHAIDLRNQIEGMAAASLRCIAFAYRELDYDDIPDDKDIQTWEIPDHGLVLVAVVGIKDPSRPGVKDAVVRCQAAGVKVRMVTGDSKFTARAIAEECGILTPNGRVVEGREFRNLDREELDLLLPNLDVMARSSPTDKLTLVKELQQTGAVVAVTGGGCNDAPVLYQADVGLSMGIAGTATAKETSDIVILDDNFASIVKVVRWGRSARANMQKFVQFLLTINMTVLVINFVSSVSSGQVPLTTVQLLWVNLILDTLGALAFATEEPTDDLMVRCPVGRRESLITNITWRNLFGQTVYQIVVLLTIDYKGEKIFKLEGKKDAALIKNTVIFNAFVLCQIFNEVNCRRPERKNIFEGLHKNYFFMGIIFIEAVVQFLIVQYLTKFATTHSLTWQQWLICVTIGFVSWPLAFLLKFIRVQEKPYFSQRRRSVMSSSSSGSDIEGPTPDFTARLVDLMDQKIIVNQKMDAAQKLGGGIPEQLQRCVTKMKNIASTRDVVHGQDTCSLGRTAVPRRGLGSDSDSDSLRQSSSGSDPECGFENKYL